MGRNRTNHKKPILIKISKRIVQSLSGRGCTVGKRDFKNGLCSKVKKHQGSVKPKPAVKHFDSSL